MKKITGHDILVAMIILSAIGLIIIAKFFPFMVANFMKSEKPTSSMTLQGWLIIGIPAFGVWAFEIIKWVKKLTK